MPDQDTLQQQIADIGIRYLKRTSGEVALLRRYVQDVREGATLSAKELEQLAHKIHGSGAMFGFDAVSERASEIEQLAKESPWNSETFRKMDAGVAALEDELKSAARVRGIE